MAAAASTRHPFSVAGWLKAIYHHPRRPSALQRDVLTALAVEFIDWKTGAGRASIKRLAEFCRVARSTVQRALQWGCEALFLDRTERGRRLWNGTVVASEWLLTMPAQHVFHQTVVQAPTTGVVSDVV